MPAEPKYNADYHDVWAWSLAIKGATDDEIADAFGVSVRTIHRWKKTHESFQKAIMAGKESADAKVEKSLYERALGYDKEESEDIVEVDKDGSTKPVRIRRTRKHYPPDTMAIMYWLNNRKKLTGEWSQAQKVELSGSVGNVDLSNLSDEELETLVKYAEAHNGDNNE